MPVEASLTLLSSKRLPREINLLLVAFCDPHDLLAAATIDWDIYILRIISGQAAFTIKRKDTECEVTALQWKADGSLLGVAWSDGTYGLYSGENGRLISQSNVRAAEGQDEFRLDLNPDFGTDDDAEEGSNVSCFGWTTHLAARSGGKWNSPVQIPAGTTTDDWHEMLDDDDHQDTTGITEKGSVATLADLTRAIATLDVTQVLPRLTAIPAHQIPYAKVGSAGNKFVSQTATDSIFETQKDVASEQVQSLFVSQDDGNVQVLMDETVKIGSCYVGGKTVHHSAHPQSSCHALISVDAESQFQLRFIDLPLSTLSGPLQHVVATNTKRIQNLLDYIIYTVRCIEHDFTTGLQAPARFLSNLNESLSEKDEGSAVYNLYHLAMTGDFSPTMLEWLVDIIKETNHKRWDQAVATMYTKLQNHLFMNLLPALDRLSIAVTTLRGQAKFHEGSSKFDVPPQLFTSMLESLDSLRLVAQRMQLVIMSEIRQFRAFSKWLRVQIEIGIAEPFSRGAIEIEEREIPSLDYPLLLTYIKDTMTCSELQKHLSLPSYMTGSCSKDEFFGFPAFQQLTYDRTKKVFKTLDDLKSGDELVVEDIDDPKAMLSLPAITVSLTGHARVATKRITEWQSRMLSPPTTVPLRIDPSATITDMTSVWDDNHPDNCTVLLSAINNSDRNNTLTMISVVAKPGPSQPPTVAAMEYTFPPGGEIIDAKFVASTRDPPTLIILFCATDGERTDVLRFLPPPIAKGADESVQPDVQHSFSTADGFRCEKLIVGGRAGKRVCVVLGNHGTEWRVLDLDGSGRDTNNNADEWVDDDSADMELG